MLCKGMHSQVDNGYIILHGYRTMVMCQILQNLKKKEYYQEFNTFNCFIYIIIDLFLFIFWLLFILVQLLYFFILNIFC